MNPSRMVVKAATLTLMHVLGPVGVFCLVWGFRLPTFAPRGLLYLGAAIALHFAHDRWLA
jgi:hypothetical protein